MSKNKIVSIVLLAGALSGATSCKKYLNVNTSPNVAQNATVQTLLPAAQLYVTSGVGVDLEINGSFWAEYWTQAPNASQYTDLDKYSVNQDNFSIPWSNLYAAAENFHQIEMLADSTKKKQYKAIALLMEAYTFQLITDGWGDVPYKQALKGQYSDGHIVNPTYDSQAVVYRGIIAMIDTANGLINPSDAVLPGTDDLIYGGDMNQWQKFSNTLKLRVYIRMGEIDPTGAAAGIAALYAKAHPFIGEGDDAKIVYGSSTANKNPLYGESTGLGSIQNLVASSSVIDSMNSNNDNRLYAFFNQTTSGGFAGIPQGTIANGIAVGSYSIPSATVGGDAQNAASASAPVLLLTSYESYFLQAEAIARGWAAGDDQAMFYQGIHASFTFYDKQLQAQGPYASAGTTTASGYTLPDDVPFTGELAYNAYVNGDTFYVTPAGTPAPSYWSIYPASGSLANKIQTIITQKWFSMCGNQGFEAWCELRRTGYPNFLPFPLFASPKQFPKRFEYPTSESTVNLNYPGLQPLTSKMWWDLL